MRYDRNMKLINKNSSNEKLAGWLLRLGLAFVFLYAAISAFRHPYEWVGYLPTFFAKSFAATTVLRAFEVVEILLAIWLLSGRYLRYAGLLAAAMLVGIVVLNPTQLIITFRDVGLALTALALAALAN